VLAKPIKKLGTRPGFQLATIALILAWTALTVTEIAAGPGTSAAEGLNRLSAAIGALFVIELYVRWRCSKSTRRFVRDYWFDMVAIVSVVPALATALPAIRLLRLLRLYRVILLVRTVPVFGGFVRHRGPRRILALGGIIALSVVVATAALLAFESATNKDLSTFDQAFWFSLYSIFATQPTPEPPVTLGGRIVSLFLIFVGLSTFAVLTGTVSAVVLSRLKMEGIVVEWEDLKEHLIICGWNRKAEIIVAEYVATHKDDPMPVVVVAKVEGAPAFTDQALRGRVQFLDDDFTKVSAMEKAGIHRASTCILLSDTTKGRNERDADARTILAALTVERINPKVYTCAELNRREYSTHLKLGCVDDFVVSGEHSAFLLAQAAINHGTLSVWSELLSYEFGHKFCRIPVPKKLVGQTFTDALTLLKRDANVVAIAVVPHGGEPKINPGAVKLAEGDELVVIADADYQA
jgi:voltage-gated potassium channel